MESQIKVSLSSEQEFLLSANGCVSYIEGEVDFYYLPIGFQPTGEDKVFRVIELKDLPLSLKLYIAEQLGYLGD